MDNLKNENNEQMDPEIFISYSWTSPKHIDWVMDLASRLTSDGVEVHVDKWELSEGQDKYEFMEKMVKSEDINKVLIILDKEYAEKADNRKGGVGTETQIISPEIYKDVSQKKFIPIIVEHNDEGEPYSPAYLKSRIYIDLSDEGQFEENYSNLLRNLFERSEFPKPKKGNPPKYLFEDSPSHYKTSSILKSFDNQINKNPKRLNSIVREFLDEFYESLKKYGINFQSERKSIIIGKEICDSINSYTPLRDDFIYFFDKVVKNDLEEELEISIVISFLEKIYSLQYPNEEKTTWNNYDFENYKFFIHEIFLYLITIGLKNENYNFIEELLYSSYYFEDRYASESEPQYYEKFYININRSIKLYYDEIVPDKLSPMADLMIKRIPERYIGDDLVNADLLCYYISVFQGRNKWFPLTYVYQNSRFFRLFRKLSSKRHFEKVKVLFNVENIDEFKKRIIEIRENDTNTYGIGYQNSFSHIEPIYALIDLESIGIKR